MKKTRLAILISCALMISACGQTLPECGADESVGVLRQVISELLKQKDKANQITISAIETKSKDEKLKKNTCAATATWTLSQESRIIIDDLTVLQPLAAISSAASGGNPWAALAQASNAKPITAETAKRLQELWVGIVLSSGATEQIKQQLLKNKENAAAQLLPVYTEVIKLINKYPFKAEDGVIDLARNKVNYVVRINEDKKDSGTFYVETSIPREAVELVNELESLPEYLKLGRDHLNKTQTEQSKKTNPSDKINPKSPVTGQPQAPVGTTQQSPTPAPVQPQVPATSAAPTASPIQPQAPVGTTQQGATQTPVQPQAPIASSAPTISPTQPQAPVGTTPQAATPAPVQPQVPATSADQAKENTNFAPSFDCAKALTGQERLICGDRELSKLDVELSVLYQKIFNQSMAKDTLRNEQNQWLKYTRNACSDKTCLEQTYKSRIQQLTDQLNTKITSTTPEIDGNWYSERWKYGYNFKNGVGIATSTNSPNFNVGQEIVYLKKVSDNKYEGRQIYTDGKFYKVTAFVNGNGELDFRGEKGASWVMRKN